VFKVIQVLVSKVYKVLKEPVVQMEQTEHKALKEYKVYRELPHLQVVHFHTLEQPKSQDR
jgi:hypothetical protein